MVSKLDKQTYTSEFESHWVAFSYGLVPHLSKKLSKFPFNNWLVSSTQSKKITESTSALNLEKAKIQKVIAQSAEAVGYPDCFSADG